MPKPHNPVVLNDLRQALDGFSSECIVYWLRSGSYCVSQVDKVNPVSLQDVIVVAVRDGRGSKAALPCRMVADSAVEGQDEIQPHNPPTPDNDLPLNPRPTNFESRESRLDPQLTHFPTFACQEDCDIIAATAAKLESTGFYWGPLGVEDAHRMLREAPLGSFLIRDSRQKGVFFTLSYHAKSGPVSVRVLYSDRKFSLACNRITFPTLFALLENFSNSPKKTLKVPYRRWNPTLQELCRKRVMELCGGASNIQELPVTHIAREFLLEFPYKL